MRVLCLLLCVSAHVLDGDCIEMWMHWYDRGFGRSGEKILGLPCRRAGMLPCSRFLQ